MRAVFGSEIKGGEVGFVDFAEAGGIVSQSDEVIVMILIGEEEVDSAFVVVVFFRFTRSYAFFEESK